MADSYIYRPMIGPIQSVPLTCGLNNLNAILEDQSYQNDVLTVGEIRAILENKDDLMPHDAVIAFRARRKLAVT